MSSDSGDSFYWIRVILASTWGTHGVGHIPNCDVRPHNSDADWRQNHRGKRHSQTTSPLHRRPQKSKATIHLILRVIVSLSWALDQRTGHRLYGHSVGRCRTVSAFRFRNFLLYCHRRSCWTFCRCRSNGPRHNLFHLTWHGKVYAHPRNILPPEPVLSNLMSLLVIKSTRYYCDQYSSYPSSSSTCPSSK